MQIKSHDFTEAYRISKQIGDVGGAIIYDGWDIMLERPVRIFMAKDTLSEDDARRFLLRARSLGRMQHSGILPIYDMGMFNDQFYYIQRIPPERSLEQMLDEQGKASSARQGHRLQILIQVADTLAYTHENGLTAGSLNLKGIMTGIHGEVVLTDWTAARWSSSKIAEDLPLEWVRDDLRELGLLAMNLLYPGPPMKETSIQEWDRRSGRIPPDLQMILDKAYLDRGEPYLSVNDALQDLRGYLSGFPSSRQKGDLVQAFRAFYRRRTNLMRAMIVVFLTGLCSSVLLFLQLATQERQLFQSGQSLEDLKRQIQGLDADLQQNRERLRSKKNDLQQLGTSDRKDHPTDSEQIELASEQRRMEGVESNLLVLESEIATDRKMLKDIQEQIDGSQERARRWLSELEQAYERDLKKSDYFEKKNDPYLDGLFRDLQQMDEAGRSNMQKWLNQNEKLGVLSSLLQTREMPLEDLGELKAAMPHNLIYSADGARMAWLQGGQLAVMDGESRNVVVSPIKIQIQNLVFSASNYRFFAESSAGRMAIIDTDGEGKVSEVYTLPWRAQEDGLMLGYEDPDYVTAFGETGLASAYIGNRPSSMGAINRLYTKSDGKIINFFHSPKADRIVVQTDRSMLILYEIQVNELRRLQWISIPGTELQGYLPGQDLLVVKSKTGAKLFDGRNLKLIADKELPKLEALWPGYNGSYLWWRDDRRLLCTDWLKNEQLASYDILNEQPIGAINQGLCVAKNSRVTLLAHPGMSLPEAEHERYMAMWAQSDQLKLRRLLKNGKLDLGGENGVMPVAGIIQDVGDFDVEHRLACILIGGQRMEVWDIDSNQCLVRLPRSKSPLQKICFDSQVMRILGMGIEKDWIQVYP